MVDWRGSPGRRVGAVCALAMVACFACVLLVSQGCHQTPKALQTQRPLVEARDVRVLISTGKESVRVRWSGEADARLSDGAAGFRETGGGWKTISADGSGVISVGGRAIGRGSVDLVPGNRVFSFQAREGDGGWTAERRYPGWLRVSVESGGLRAINFADIESYVACVLPGEIYPDFHQEAYRAQAVAARTYVLYQMARRGRSDYDVTATEASQVYQGIARGATAQRAAEATAFSRGIVATWSSPGGERIFCTYYSSCCGGMTQNAVNCKVAEEAIPPLSGGVTCRCGRVAKPSAYRWGPVSLSKDEVTRRLAQRYPEFASANRVERIEVKAWAKSGRPKVFRMVGRGGFSKEMVAEDFRLAMGSREIRSTHFRISTERDGFVFSEGRGFGHAMGLCQWGMQEMALSNHKASAILRHYYPSMRLTKAY